MVWGGLVACRESALPMKKAKREAGSTAPPSRKRAERLRFFAKRQAVWFETRSVSH